VVKAASNEQINRGVNALREVRSRIKEHKRVKVRDLVPHELNWRVHNDKQREVLLSLFREVGVVRSLLVYPCGKKYKIIDGHMRQDVLGKLDPNMDVDVEVADLNDSEALKMLLSLDPLTQLATTNSPLLKKIRRQIKAGDEVQAGFFSQLMEREGVARADELELDLEEDGSTASGVPLDFEVQESQVKMVSLYLNVATHAVFDKQIKALQPLLNADNPTDVVMECVKRVYGEMVRKGKNDKA
jgi:hypothetical protein